MTTIAILDDGISSSRIPTLGKIERWIAVAEDGAISQGDEPDKMTHGTLCAAIICSYAPDAKLISVKVLDPTTLKGSINQIRYALEWCIAQNVSLINLSIGSTSFKDWKLLQPVIARLIRNNIPLICACSNNNTPSIFRGRFPWRRMIHYLEMRTILEMEIFLKAIFALQAPIRSRRLKMV